MSDPTGQPELHASWFNGICDLGPKPLVATGLFRVWLTHHFSKASYIEDQSPALVRDLWYPEIDRSKIMIESVFQWDPRMVEQRPAIMIKCNPWEHIRLGIANKMMPIAPDGIERYTNWWKGSHTLFCITGDGGESLKLAAEVYRELNQYSDVIRKILDMKKFEVMKVDADGYIVKTDARENVAIPITVGYVFEEAWKVPQDVPILDGAVLRIDMAQFQP